MEITTAIIEDAAAILVLQRLAYQSEAAIYDDFTIPPLTETLCGGQLLDIRRKVCCVQCHSIIETCCD